MADYKDITLSLQNGGGSDDVQIEHDDREYDENGKPYFSDNVDVSRSGDNWYYEENMSVKEFYEREFETAYREQQQKNIDNRHPERNKYSSYYEEVMTKQREAEAKFEELKNSGMKKKDIKREMAATTKVAYQTIIQLGNNTGDFRTMNNSPENIALGKKLLIDFINDWKKNYPDMKIINAAIHCDEIGKPDKNGNRPGGTVHAHITYCPVARSYKKGMPVRNSLTRTLTDMGFPDDKQKTENGFHFGIEKWQQKMRDDFDKHIQKFGYKRVEPTETRTQHESIEDYQKRMDQKKTVAKNSEIIEQQKKDMREFEISHDDVVEMATEGENLVLEDLNNLHSSLKDDFKQMKEDIKKELHPDKSDNFDYVEKKKGGLFSRETEKIYQVPEDEFNAFDRISYYNNIPEIEKRCMRMISLTEQNCNEMVSRTQNKISSFFMQFKPLRKLKETYEKKVAELREKHKIELAAKDKEIDRLKNEIQQKNNKIELLQSDIDEKNQNAENWEDLVNSLNVIAEPEKKTLISVVNSALDKFRNRKTVAEPEYSEPTEPEQENRVHQISYDEEER